MSATDGHRLRIVLADEQSLFREALRTVLETQAGWEVVAEADDGVQAVAQVQRTGADIALVSTGLPNRNGMETTRCIKDVLDGRVRVVVLADDHDVPLLVEALQAGAHGYVAKRAPLGDLINATAAVARGEMVVPPRMLGPLLSQLIRHRRERDDALRRLARLTPREREVLGLLAGGRDNDQIASYLVISPETARTHIHNLLGKLDVHSRLAAVTFVLQNGLMEELEAVET